MKKIYKYLFVFFILIILSNKLFNLYYYDKSTMFDMEKKKLIDSGVIEKDIYYIAENFSSYGNIYSKSIDQMEDINGIILQGNAKNLKISSDYYGGNKSISFTIYGNNKNDSATIRRNFVQSFNLSRWDDKGYFTSWIKLDNRSGILGVSLVIGDKNGNYRSYNELINMQIDDPDLIKINDEYPDLSFVDKNEGVKEWQDFRLVSGWNYLFWRTDQGYFVDTTNNKDNQSVDMSNIIWYEIVLNLSSSVREQNINLDNLRVQDGLQRSYNPANGNWYAPNGAPQYGVFDIDETITDSNDFKLRLLNVRQTQYPSNGDHTRILSKKATPLNFTMQIYFKIADLPQKWNGNLFNYSPNRINTWLRVQYDFDNEYDPGHDWYGTFISFEHDKFGLVSTYPVIRYFKQAQEPIEFGTESRKDISLKKNTMYILDIKAVGQNENSIIYEVNNGNLKEISNVIYTFKRQRYSDKRYPLSIETTGNIRADIYSVHVISLDR